MSTSAGSQKKKKPEDCLRPATFKLTNTPSEWPDGANTKAPLTLKQIEYDFPEECYFFPPNAPPGFTPQDNTHKWLAKHGLPGPTRPYRVTLHKKIRGEGGKLKDVSLCPYECFAHDASEAIAFTCATYGVQAVNYRAETVELETD